MPRYFFHLHNDDRLADDEGTSCTTLDEMKCHARQVASELGAHHSDQHNRDRHISVTDERGDEIYRVSLAAACEVTEYGESVLGGRGGEGRSD
jgi:hypothetical protein